MTTAGHLDVVHDEIQALLGSAPPDGWSLGDAVRVRDALLAILLPREGIARPGCLSGRRPRRRIVR